MTLRISVRTAEQWAIAVDTLAAGDDTLNRFDEVIRRFAEDAMTGQSDKTLSYWLAGLADNEIRDVLSPVPLPSDTIRADEVKQYDTNYVAAVLLAVIAWLLTVAGPVMISKLPQADQSTMSNYYSGIPAAALMLTGYIITHRPKGK